MPVPEITPPGHLDLHGVLVAVAPAAIAGAGAVAAALLEWGASPRRRRLVRVFAAINLLGALAISALFLRPDGPAAAYTEPLATGLVRIGWTPCIAALLFGLWVAWYWLPWREGTGPGSSSWAWSARVGIALLLPMSVIPLFALWSVLDVGEQDPLSDPPPRAIPIALTILGTVASGIILLSSIPRIYASGSAGITLLLVALTMGGPWRILVGLAGISLLLPW